MQAYNKMEKTKAILIPDLHGRMFWKEAVANAEEDTRIVFLGDYIDPYGFEEITPKKAFDIFVEVLDFARSHPHVELLLGNHDCGYIFGEEVCRCRTDEERYVEIRQLFLDNLDLFKFCTEAKAGGRRYLISHAGINRHWLEAHAGELFPNGEIDYESLCESINRYLLNEPMDYSQVLLLSEAGPHRGGRDPFSSIVWADIDEFEDPLCHIPIDQIVGHTLQVFEEFDKEDYTLYYGGVCIKRGPQSTVYCIDTAEAYRLDTEGTLRYLRNDEPVEEHLS